MNVIYKSVEICLLISQPSIQSLSHECDLFTCTKVLYNCWYDFYTNWCDVFASKNVLYTCSYVFFSHGCNVRAWNLFWASVAKPVLWQLMILLPSTFAHMSSIPMGAIYLYMQECFFHSLIPLLFPWVQCIYMQECSVHSLIRLLFPCVQCQSLKPVLSQCSQTSFVTVDDFIARYTCSYVFYSHGCNVFIRKSIFLHSLIWSYPLWAPIFTVITKVWPYANRAVVTNNLTLIIEVVLIKGFLYHGSTTRKIWFIQILFYTLLKSI